MLLRWQIEKMKDEEIIKEMPYEEAVEVLMKRYEGYLHRLAETVWKETLGNLFVPREDLISAAKLGLAKAVKTYDPTKEASFLTYMVTVVNNCLRHEVRRYMPISLGKFECKTEEEKEKLGELLNSFISIEAAEDDEERTQEEEIGEVCKELEEIEKRWKIRQALKCLPPIEQKVISLIYGLEGNYPLTLKEVSRILGYTVPQVQYIHQRALKKLRSLLS
jgi:RNA polymerase sigma factor, sigma-70 family